MNQGGVMDIEPENSSKGGLNQMADEEQQDRFEEGAIEEESQEEQKRRFPEKWLRLLMYLGLFFGVLFVSVVSAIVVYELRGADAPMRDILREVSVAVPVLDVYSLPEFKLALDQRGEESLTTIVQVKMGLAYESGNQRILDEIIQRKDQIQDRVQYVVARKSYDEISTADSREEILKQDLLYALENVLEAEVLDVYFDTFVITRIPG